MRKTFTPIILLAQLFFLTTFIVDTMVGMHVVRWLNAPITIIFVLVSNIVLFANAWLLNREEARRQVEETELVLQEKFQSLVASVRSDRHDMNNHLTVISGLTQLKKNDSASQYIQKLLGDINVNNEILQVHDPVLASLIFAAYSKFNASNIQFNVEIGSYLIVEKLSMTDLVRLISNLLDNAFEEVLQQFGQERQISISITEDTQGIQLIVTNPTNAVDFDEKWLEMNGSSRGDSEQRGYGLSIIQDVVRRYEGDIQFKIDHGAFIAHVTFPVVRQ
jgi:sensor histidine kinase regulating citrate/malate metabolism